MSAITIAVAGGRTFCGLWTVVSSEAAYGDTRIANTLNAIVKAMMARHRLLTSPDYSRFGIGQVETRVAARRRDNYGATFRVDPYPGSAVLPVISRTDRW